VCYDINMTFAKIAAAFGSLLLFGPFGLPLFVYFLYLAFKTPKDRALRTIKSFQLTK
jgi:hypothetical protein